jgi:hypothetical protein
LRKPLWRGQEVFNSLQFSSFWILSIFNHFFFLSDRRRIAFLSIDQLADKFGLHKIMSLLRAFSPQYRFACPLGTYKGKVL